MKKWILFLACVLPVSLYAQQASPDNEDILLRTLDSASPYYYPALKFRYDAGDTTLTAADYHYLYYGFAYREEYKPLHPIPSEERLLEVLVANERPNTKDAEQIVRYANEVMKADPFSPQNLNFLTFAYGILGDTVWERINADRLNKVLATIDASGSGLKEDSPKHVIRFSHASDLLASKGLQVGKRTVVSRSVEYIDLPAREDRKTKGYYFDFSRVYWNKPDERPKPERRWQFNNLPLNNKKTPLQTNLNEKQQLINCPWPADHPFAGQLPEGRSFAFFTSSRTAKTGIPYGIALFACGQQPA